MKVFRAIRRIWRLFKFTFVMAIGAFLAIVVIGTIYLNSQSDLSVWHTALLEEEFTANSGVSTFQGYLELEDRLFRELDDKVIRQTDWGARDEINRFQPGSVSDPGGWQRNWNRSFLLEAQDARASVLLLHGMSDSPYSLKSIGEALHADGLTVLGLRLPGHGTAPSGLLDITWQDMFAATEIGVRHLHDMAPDRPVYVVGYSNGAALAVLYALRQTEDSRLPRVAAVSILSPAIGITPAAAYAEWVIRLGHVLGLQKLAWNSVLPEYDPYKYSSFTVNAGFVTYQLTRQIQFALAEIKAAGRLEEVPPIQAFSSVVDATVLPQDLVSNLFNRLPGNGSELVFFDINRAIADTPLFSFDPSVILNPLKADTTRQYAIRLVTNASEGNPAAVKQSYAVGSIEGVETPLGLAWPADIYSLSHIALPFEKSDPLYGDIPQPGISRLQLGSVILRGEKSVLRIPAADLLRIHWNPFHDFMLDEIRRFFGGAQGSTAEQGQDKAADG